MAFCRSSIDQRPVSGVHHLSLVRQTRLLCLECRRGECVTGFPYTTTLKTNIDRIRQFPASNFIIILFFPLFVSRVRACWRPIHNGCWSWVGCWPLCRSYPFPLCSYCDASSSSGSIRTLTKVSYDAMKRPFQPNKWWPMSTWVPFCFQRERERERE